VGGCREGSWDECGFWGQWALVGRVSCVYVCRGVEKWGEGAERCPVLAAVEVVCDC
jgi:hypothetical protein